MDEETLKGLLEGVHRGDVSVRAALQRLKNLPFEDIGLACIDHHRGIRRGLSEVIFGEGKDVSQILAIMGRMHEQGENIMVTRLSPDKAEKVREKFPKAAYHDRARVLTVMCRTVRAKGRGTILVISAGTSDIPVAEEAAITARFMGNRVETIYDVGVSGLHRVLSHRDRLTEASVVIVVAGMEGALPSVVGGLVDRPVIAVPTSVGYGASFQGVAALLGMLNSCASGVTVVNIDNGFGAGYAASLMNRRRKAQGSRRKGDHSP
ncbi:MAG: nickel pincer cofactor biosynthesis protein LarB [Deltaproteobacteria bacterium]|nr:nickel pincer cofactor biosynthesis protein LarB [Deltaproteobacteria bacterium]